MVPTAFGAEKKSKSNKKHVNITQPTHSSCKRTPAANNQIAGITTNQHLKVRSKTAQVGCLPTQSFVFEPLSCEEACCFRFWKVDNLMRTPPALTKFATPFARWGTVQSFKPCKACLPFALDQKWASLHPNFLINPQWSSQIWRIDWHLLMKIILQQDITMVSVTIPAIIQATSWDRRGSSGSSSNARRGRQQTTGPTQTTCGLMSWSTHFRVLGYGPRHGWPNLQISESYPTTEV